MVERTTAMHKSRVVLQQRTMLVGDVYLYSRPNTSVEVHDEAGSPDQEKKRTQGDKKKKKKHDNICTVNERI